VIILLADVIIRRPAQAIVDIMDHPSPPRKARPEDTDVPTDEWDTDEDIEDPEED